MKRETLLTLAAVVALLTTGCQPDPQVQPQTSNPSAAEDQRGAAATSGEPQQIAIAAKDELFKQLSTRLIAAMSNGGPAAAIEVCSREAPKIAAAVGKEHGVTIGRTSFRLRNPKNAPPEWTKPLIDKRNEQAEFVSLPDGGTGALLPIKLKTQCLACHGPTEQIADDVMAKLTELYPDDQATGFNDGDLRGWFWVVVPGESKADAPGDADPAIAEDHEQHAAHGPGHGMGRGRGMMGRGPGQAMRGDMTTIHAMFDNRDKIKRTVKDLPNGAEALTESEDEQVAALIQEHVPAMEGRVVGNEPLPPMTFHPVFVELIKHADDYTLTYEETDKGIMATYQADDPFVITLVREHAKLVSRFIKSGMEEIHKPYTLPQTKAGSTDAASVSSVSGEESLANWPPLPTVAESPKDNPTTAAKVELGKKLFFDPRLSLTGTVSCNSCHNVMEGGDDGRSTSMGIEGRLGARNAPTVWNAVFQTAQFWDGRAASLEEQAAGPMVAQPEMGMPNHDVVIARIKAIPGYVSEFREVFGDNEPVTIDATVKAIAAFERTLITPNSAYDRFAQGNESALTAQQLRGMKLFDSVGCTECHAGPNFNNWEPGASTVAFEEFPRSTDSSLVAKYSLDKDLGRYEATKNDADKHYFKTPTLRNITLTAPYFHNGTVPTLHDAVQVMSVTQLDTELADAELDDLVAFFGALEGDFPALTLPRIPSRPSESILDIHKAMEQQRMTTQALELDDGNFDHEVIQSSRPVPVTFFFTLPCISKEIEQ
jgi:cytochrome c peroxidase